MEKHAADYFWPRVLKDAVRFRGTTDDDGDSAVVFDDAEVDARIQRLAPQLLDYRFEAARIDGRSIDGASFQRIGFALAAGGIGCRFFDRYYEAPNPSRGTIIKVIARTIGGLVASAVRPGRARGPDLFRPTRAKVVIDGEEVTTRTHNALHAGAFDVNLGGVLRVFPQAREPGVLQFQAGEISPAKIIAHLPALVAGGAVRGDRLRDTVGRKMTITIENGDEPLSPIIDGERFAGLDQLVVNVGPRVRIARPTHPQSGRRLRVSAGLRLLDVGMRLR